MSGYGFHWSRCPGGEGGGFLVVGAALVAVEVIVSALWEIIAVTAACAVLAFAIVLLLTRATSRREAAYEASPQHQRLIGAIPVTPQVTQGTTPAIETHNHFYFADEATAARILRSAVIPPPAREELTP